MMDHELLACGCLAGQAAYTPLLSRDVGISISGRSEERVLPAEAEAFVKELRTFRVKDIGSDK